LLEPQVETLGGREEVTLIGIERTVVCDGQPTTWRYYFTTDRYPIWLYACYFTL